MTGSRYSVVRYVPDPAREECINVGVVVTTDDGGYVACRFVHNWSRAARFGGKDVAFLKDFAESLKTEIQRQPSLLQPERFTGKLLAAFATDWCNSIQFSVPRASVAEDPSVLLGELAAQFLVEEPSSEGHASPVHVLERRFRDLLRENRLVRRAPLTDARTGLPRPVDFFVNSGANIALDALQLALKRPREIENRADAEAHKIEGIKAGQPLRMVVYCAISEDQSMVQPNDYARRSLEYVGAKVLTDAEAVSREVRQALGLEAT